MAAVAVDAPQQPDAGCPNSVLGKARLILGAFEAGAYRLRLTELSRRSGVAKASCYRIAQELVQWGLLERVGDSYQLGLAVFELGQRVPVSAVLRVVARPLLVDLFAATRATVHLAVLEGSHVLYVEKVAGEANILTHSEVGGRLPATCTATGKVLLATRPEGEAVVAGLDGTPLVRPTSRSTPTPEALRAQLVEVRRAGFAVELEETKVGFGSVAVPVVGADGSVSAAVSTTLPADRIATARLVPALRATANGIARAVERRLLERGAGAEVPTPLL
ncbi:IclR family transcriptional regulator [Actinomycetospora chlora]|jgi:DNA-binding IclR family transcriptional regulator|uniref:IclR family transcriptional regulator n=1 Tax=Actinomycetospora chlora TaxID=663608 RepID=A0ABP9CJP0_9PSEU